MNLRSRFGYLILALKQYPFDKEIKERIEKEWAAIKDVYIDGTLTVEGASIKYLHCSKSLAYKEVIEPFFSNLEKKIYELSVNTKININLEKS